jgi:transcriptional regulator with XRE-family HTH domain
LQTLAAFRDPYIIVLKHQHHQWFMSAPGVRRNRLPLPTIFGREVRRRRVALGLTLEQLAERSGLTPNYIGTVENGRRDPSLSTVLSLANGLGVPAGELVGGVAELGPVGMETARLMEAVPPELQDAILELARAIAKRRR